MENEAMTDSSDHDNNNSSSSKQHCEGDGEGKDDTTKTDSYFLDLREPQEEQQAADEGAAGGEDGDKASRVSRLFYLQLYESVLKAGEEPHDIGESNSDSSEKSKKRKKKSLTKGISLPKVVRSLSWMDVTNLLSRTSSSSLQSTEQERDLGDSFHPKEMAIHHLDNNNNNNNTSATMRGRDRRNIDELLKSDRRIEPILNDRMKDLNNFTMRYRDRQEHVIEQKTYSCNFKKLLRNSMLVFLGCLVLLLVLLVLLSSPGSLSGHFETVYVEDSDRDSYPKVGLCLKMPFRERVLRELRVTSNLASFLLYSITPFSSDMQRNDENNILDDSDLLTDLTSQYRILLSRIHRQKRGKNYGLRKVMKNLAPKCSDVISTCQFGADGSVLEGITCCQSIFSRTEFSLRGVCFIAEDFVRRSSDKDFPITNPGTMAKFSFTLKDIGGDHLLVKRTSIAARAPATLTVGYDVQEMFYKSSKNDIQIDPGQTYSIAIKKLGVESSSWISGLTGQCSDLLTGDDIFGHSSHTESSCRNLAVQGIAEKSVNCSLISLPRLSRNLPFCGPLEGLALSYILREQGAMVSTNPELLSTFEQSIESLCPSKCKFNFFQPEEIVSGTDLQQSKKTFARIPRQEKSLTTIHLHYKTENFVQVKRYQSGVIVFIQRFGSVCGILSLLVLLGYLLKQVFSNRKRFFFRRKKTKRRL